MVGRFITILACKWLDKIGSKYKDKCIIKFTVTNARSVEGGNKVLCARKEKKLKKEVILAVGFDETGSGIFINTTNMLSTTRTYLWQTYNHLMKANTTLENGNSRYDNVV